MLEAVPDLGYLPTDTAHHDSGVPVPCLGRGEICMRGPHVFKEYYKVRTSVAASPHKDVTKCVTGHLKMTHDAQFARRL
jgi:hypothetical protein